MIGLADRYREARANVLAYLLCGAGMSVLALAVPKSGDGANLRLACTIVFFTGLITTLSAFVGPLGRYLRIRSDLLWQDAGDEVRSTHHALATRIDHYGRALAYPLIVGVTALLFRVLSAWPVGQPLARHPWLVSALEVAFWVGLAAAIAQACLSTHRLVEIVAIWRAARRQVELGGWARPSGEDLARRNSALAGPPVVLKQPNVFEAGGMDWSWGDFQKSAVVFGIPGSGKTVTVLNALLDGLLGSADRYARPAALILDPKGDYSAKLDRLVSRLGRRDDLRILDPANPGRSVRWNPFDSPDDALEIAGRFATALALTGQKATQDTFFVDSAKTFLRHAIGLQRIAAPGGPPSFVRCADLVRQPRIVLIEGVLYLLRCGLPALGRDVTPEALRDALEEDLALDMLLENLENAEALPPEAIIHLRRWLALDDEAYAAHLPVARALYRPAAQAGPAIYRPGSEGAAAIDYMLDAWLTMPEVTRGGIQSQLAMMLDPLLVEPYRSLFGGRSTVSMGEVLDHGLIFLSALPVEDRPEMARLISTMLKLDFYRQVLLRVDKERPSLFFCDEFQTVYSADQARGDGTFFSRSRQSRHANLVATQNLSGLIGGAAKPEIVKSFLGSCAIKIFLRNTDSDTNEYASKDLFGEYSGVAINLNQSGAAQGGRAGFGLSSQIGEQLQRQRRVPPERFVTLAVPDRDANVAYSEALVHLGSRAEILTPRLRFPLHPLDE